MSFRGRIVRRGGAGRRRPARLRRARAGLRRRRPGRLVRRRRRPLGRGQRPRRRRVGRTHLHLARRRRRHGGRRPARRSIFLWRAARRIDACFVAAAVVGITVLVWVLKNVYERARPDHGSPIALPHSYSFPSGHAATAVVLYGALGLLLAEQARSRLRAVGWLVAAAVRWRSRSERAASCSTSTSSATSSPASPSASPGSAAARSCATCWLMHGRAAPHPQLGSARGRPGEPTSRAAARGARSPARLGS